jgi:aspartate kinase
MRQALAEGQIVIVAGFQGIDENWNITTLGRGGSDTTAVALAAVMKHDPGEPGTSTPGYSDVDCEIYSARAQLLLLCNRERYRSSVSDCEPETWL